MERVIHPTPHVSEFIMEIFVRGSTNGDLARYLKSLGGRSPEGDWAVIDRLAGLGGSLIEEAPFVVTPGKLYVKPDSSDRDPSQELRLKKGEVLLIQVYTDRCKRGRFDLSIRIVVGPPQ